MTNDLIKIFEIVYFYKIISKDGNYVYVGKTINFHRRYAQHITLSYDHNVNIKLYKIIRENGYWWNFDMILIETKYNITSKEVQDTEQYYMDYYNCNLNSNRAKEQEKIKVTQFDRHINLLKDIANYNINSSNFVKLHYDLLMYLQINLFQDYDKNIIKHFIVDNNKKNYLIGFTNDILTKPFIEFCNEILLKDYNSKINLKKHKKINVIELDPKEHLLEIVIMIKFYLLNINLRIDYGSNMKHQSKLLKSLQFTIQKCNKNILLYSPTKKVKNINFLPNLEITIYKDIEYIETINNKIIIKPIKYLKRKNVDKKYYDNNIGLCSELYKSYNNVSEKNRRFYIKYYNDITRKKILNFINIQVKTIQHKIHIKTDYQNNYYKDFDNFDKMEFVFKELLKLDTELYVVIPK